MRDVRKCTLQSSNLRLQTSELVVCWCKLWPSGSESGDDGCDYLCCTTCAAFYLDGNKACCSALPNRDNVIAELIKVGRVKQ